MTSSTNERQIRARDQQQRRDRVTDEIVTKQLMSFPDGRRWVWNRLAEGGMFRGDESLEPYQMAFDKGKRNAALRLLKDVQVFAANEYILMTNEAQAVEAAITKKDPNYVGSASNPTDPDNQSDYSGGDTLPGADGWGRSDGWGGRQ